MRLNRRQASGGVDQAVRAGPGRPRDPVVSEAILTSTRELLAEVGYQRMTLDAVARRAGVSRPTLRLRWKSKAELVHDAVFEQAAAIPIPDTGSLEADLRACLANTIRIHQPPEVQAALVGLLDECRRDPQLRQSLRKRVYDPAAAAFQGLLERAADRGELAAAIDADVLMDVINGAVLDRILVSGADLIRLVDQLAPMLAAGLRGPLVRGDGRALRGQAARVSAAKGRAPEREASIALAKGAKRISG